MDTRNTRLAVVTDDGMTVSSHFGRAPYYEILTTKDGIVTQRERREKHSPHATMEGQGSGHQHHAGNHSLMLAPIRDCQIVVARGMGLGAYEHLTSDGFAVFLTDLRTIDEVAQSAASETLDHNDARIHHRDHTHT